MNLTMFIFLNSDITPECNQSIISKGSVEYDILSCNICKKEIYLHRYY